MSEPTSPLETLIYVSTARRPFSDEELAELLRKSRAKNRRLGVTGLLVYCGGNFLQVLEGTAEKVEALYEEIAKDARHIDVQRIAILPIAARGFPDWAMAYGYCPTREQFDGCVNLLRNGGEGLRDRVAQGNKLRSLIVGFIEGNLPGFDPGVLDEGADAASSAPPGR